MSSNRPSLLLTSDIINMSPSRRQSSTRNTMMTTAERAMKGRCLWAIHAVHATTTGGQATSRVKKEQQHTTRL